MTHTVAVRDAITMRLRSHVELNGVVVARDFTARLLQAGDRYGLDRCLTWGTSKFSGEKGSPFEGELGVEIYDATYAGDPRFEIGLGQFVSRYYVSTLLESSAANGLNLQGDVPAWKLDLDANYLLRKWLRNVTAA